MTIELIPVISNSIFAGDFAKIVIYNIGALLYKMKCGNYPNHFNISPHTVPTQCCERQEVHSVNLGCSVYQRVTGSTAGQGTYVLLVLLCKLCTCTTLVPPHCLNWQHMSNVQYMYSILKSLHFQTCPKLYCRNNSKAICGTLVVQPLWFATICWLWNLPF